MKKKIRIKVRQEAEIDVEVEFPIYSRHDMDGDGWSATWFHRRDEDGTLYSVKVEGRQVELEIARWSPSNGSEADYVLGTGDYESSKAEFEAAVAKAQAVLAKFGS